jgi:hypothetical protein
MRLQRVQARLLLPDRRGKSSREGCLGAAEGGERLR